MSEKRIVIFGVDRSEDIDSLIVRAGGYNIRFKKSNIINYYHNEDVEYYEYSEPTHYQQFKKIADKTLLPNNVSILGKAYKEMNLVPGTILYKYLYKEPFKHYNDDTSLIFPFKFNQSQLNATRNAFSNELSIIQGPPGTGKTQTILNIVSNVLMRGQNVAVISNNNTAVENIKEKLDKEGYHFLYALLGNKANRENFFNNENLKKQETDPIVMSDKEYKSIINQVQSLYVKLNYLMKLEENRRILLEELSKYRIEQKHFNAAYADIPDQEKISLIPLDANKIVDFLVDHKLVFSKKEELNLINKFTFFIKFGIYKFKELYENEYEIIMKYQEKFYQLKIKGIEKEIERLDKKLRNSDMTGLSKEHHELSKKLFSQKIEKYSNKNSQYTSINYKKNFYNFTKEYPVILSTAYSICESISKGFKFDYIIIDEASTLDLVKAMLPFSCAKNIVIVGDRKQLPHIPNTTDVIIEDEMYDYNNKSIMDSLDAIYGDRICNTLLREHYRCHPDIIRFCNMKYYNDDLVIYSDAKNTSAINVIKTNKGNHMRVINKGVNKGTFNQREIEELFRFIKDSKKYNIELFSNELKDIGLVTPYKLQVEIANVDEENKEMEKDTVHKYQGREKPVMIFSSVLDETIASNCKMNFVNDAKLVNVALSRAINQFVMVSNVNTFYKHGNEIGDLIKYIEYHDKENIVKGNVISVFDLLYTEYSDKLIKIKEMMNTVIQSTKYKSELIIASVIEELLKEDIFNCYSYKYEVLLSNLFTDLDKFDNKEVTYIKNRCSVDFVIYNKANKEVALCIEVDGTAFHLNNPDQLKKDALKNSIFKKTNVPLLRFETHTSITEKDIKKELLKYTQAGNTNIYVNLKE